jgi:hypothetical protein
MMWRFDSGFWPREPLPRNMLYSIAEVVEKIVELYLWAELTDAALGSSLGPYTK